MQPFSSVVYSEGMVFNSPLAGGHEEEGGVERAAILLEEDVAIKL